ncbi:hypothetical protein TEA_023390 [Camellia sinensis var. sinensis]|uniref:Uncharacterized protein n=1 Tax=Camellia sinensis var. sinensis TaxID=542762 RepID=A0A4S4E516_CAMSN|nr:hypothetical protein TEA_023390 [Camellia sinensis var. sinensis]
MDFGHFDLEGFQYLFGDFNLVQRRQQLVQSLLFSSLCVSLLLVQFWLVVWRSYFEQQNSISYGVNSHNKENIKELPLSVCVYHVIAEVLPPEILDAEVHLKLALTRAINDCLIGEAELAQYFLAILNLSDEYKQWSKLSTTASEKLSDDKVETLVNSELDKRRKQYATDHTQIAKCLVSVLIAALFLTLASSDAPFIVTHKKATLTRLKSDVERVSTSIDIYNQGSAGPLVSHAFELESEVLQALFYGALAVITFRIPQRLLYRFGILAISFEAYSTPILPLDILADRPSVKKFEWTRNATGLVAPAIAAGLGALTHTLGTLVPVIRASAFATVAAATAIGTVVSSFK